MPLPQPLKLSVLSCPFQRGLPLSFPLILPKEGSTHGRPFLTIHRLLPETPSPTLASRMPFSQFIFPPPSFLSRDNFALLQSWKPSRVTQPSASDSAHYDITEYTPLLSPDGGSPAHLFPGAHLLLRHFAQSAAALLLQLLPIPSLLPTPVCRSSHPYRLLWTFPSLKNFL